MEQDLCKRRPGYYPVRCVFCDHCREDVYARALLRVNTPEKTTELTCCVACASPDDVSGDARRAYVEFVSGWLRVPTPGTRMLGRSTPPTTVEEFERTLLKS
jgi:hypothetical protein